LLYLVNAIDYHKDVEGIHNYNLGKLISKQEGVKPATPKAVISMLKHYDIPIEGKKVCIVGRSAILGSPLAMNDEFGKRDYNPLSLQN